MVNPLHLPGHNLVTDGIAFRAIDAVISVPSSKSVANRVLICALLAEGESTISDLPDGDDVSAMRDALLGRRRLQAADGSDPSVSTSVRVMGGPSQGPYLAELVQCRLAGTTSRFLTAVAALQSSDVTITGDEPLRRRPMAPLHEALRGLGAVVDSDGHGGTLPVTVRRGQRMNHRVEIDGSMSSQFISALMMIGPCLGDGLVILVNGDMVSRSYVDMTAECMRLFGADVQFVGNEIRIAATPYIPAAVSIEPDFSSAAFPIAAVLVKGGRVRVKQLATARMQGDQEILDIAKEMGAVVGRDGDDIVVIVDPAQQRQPIDRDMSNCSDLVPAVAMSCSVADGTSRLRNIGFIRAKESDRLSDLAHELGKFGCRISVVDDDLVIEGIEAFHSARIDPHHDHRMAMASALGCLRGADVLIDDPDVVSKSWPGYFAQMSEILRPS